MSEKQFKAWLRVKLSNLALVCGKDASRADRLLSRLGAVYAEAEQRERTVKREKAA